MVSNERVWLCDQHLRLPNLRAMCYNILQRLVFQQQRLLKLLGQELLGTPVATSYQALRIYSGPRFIVHAYLLLAHAVYHALYANRRGFCTLISPFSLLRDYRIGFKGQRNNNNRGGGRRPGFEATFHYVSRSCTQSSSSSQRVSCKSVRDYPLP